MIKRAAALGIRTKHLLQSSSHTGIWKPVRNSVWNNRILDLSLFSDTTAKRHFSYRTTPHKAAENTITFSDDLDIKFSFDYRNIYPIIHKVNESNIQFVFDASKRQHLLDTLEIGMKILLSSNAEEKVSLTHHAHFLPSDNDTPKDIATRSISNSLDEGFEKQLSELRNKYLNEFCGEHYMPGRPEKPLLVEDARQLPKSYKQAKVSYPILLLHNMAHIELNAIDLCWHTLIMCLLNPIMGKCSNVYNESSEIAFHSTEESQLHLFDFMNDFIKIAKDEARHFTDLSERLNALGSYYGAVTSHKAIWNLARDTQYSLLERVVIGNCVLESRGLDSGDRHISKMTGCGDMISCNIVRTICQEEEDHVRIGVKWFNNISQVLFKNLEGSVVELPSSFENFQKQLFQQIVLKYYGPLPGPFNHQARTAANMHMDWYEEISREKIMKK
ncbi:hypothetical protein C9374_013236 [Naegleria lovaniensis]|uniref:Uncharacterized protein n=1 Tax=Naegleria lovaniensis TaxID=51637 RepID=A0AA88H298_NAELO|nr:uncharacterized protein C9374_013236 [Naegleria lovaniensis]KAG2391751.1 hypothetical protein C9374_013236 [Naegleria lovaniensis]